jgi:hypothetical protein
MVVTKAACTYETPEPTRNLVRAAKSAQKRLPERSRKATVRGK